LLGGAEVEIIGYGFSADTSVSIDGVSCEILSVSFQKVTCRTGAASQLNADIGNEMAGTHGVKKTSCPHADPPNPANCISEVVTSLSGAINVADSYSVTYETLFNAPISGEYQFLAYGDDHVVLEVNGTNVTTSTWHDAYGQFFSNQNAFNQTWMTLEEGELYKIKVSHSEWTGGDFMRTSVQIRNSSISADHPQAKVPKVSQIQIHQENLVLQEAHIIVNPIENFNDSTKNGGEFYL
jgi:hypothetical protein